MTSNATLLVIALAVLFTLQSKAAENQQEPVPGPDHSGEINPISDDDIEPADISAEQTPKPTPQGDNLRARDIGDAFKNFQPSEEISADNAVTFPVDI